MSLYLSCLSVFYKKLLKQRVKKIKKFELRILNENCIKYNLGLINIEITLLDENAVKFKNSGI